MTELPPFAGDGDDRRAAGFVFEIPDRRDPAADAMRAHATTNAMMEMIRSFTTAQLVFVIRVLPDGDPSAQWFEGMITWHLISERKVDLNGNPLSESTADAAEAFLREK